MSDLDSVAVPSEEPRSPKTIEREIAAEVKVTASVEASVSRVLDEVRLAVLGVVLATAVAIAFGVGEATHAWWIGVGAGLVTVIAASVAFRWRRSRNALASYADFVLRRR
jgi:hypothetical protein